MNKQSKLEQELIRGTPCEHKASRTPKGHIARRLAEAMTKIESEIEHSEGIYPYNGGRLSQAELCRRAGVRQDILQNRTHRDSTRHDVNAWLKRTVENLVTGKRIVRKTVTRRVDELKEKFEKMVAECQIAKVEAAELRQKLSDLERRR